MADRPTVNGWNNINSNKPEEYSSEFTVDGNRYANVTNVTTGQRQLYFVQPLTNARGNPITTTNADGTVTKGGNYDNFVKFQGLTKLQNAEKANKQQSTKLLSTPEISTKDELAKIKDSKEFKSSLANVGTTGNIDDIQSSTSKDLGNQKDGTRDKFPILQYPEKLQIDKQDVIKFNMVKYSPKNFASSESSGFGFSSRIQAGSKDEAGNTRNIIGTVTLPIPGGISDGNLVDWGSQSMNALQIEAAKVALETINGGGKEGADAAITGLENFKKNIGEARTGLSNYFAESAVGNTGQLLARTQGAITNPNMELLFNGPQLRPFNFTFKLSPRSKKEAESIRSIIRFFKQGMSPIRTKSNLFLKAPHTFQIQYLHKKEEHKFINKIKECALQSFVVNYTPEGNYATFTDGAMVSYEIQMQFTELEPIFNDDYSTVDGNNDTYIGY
jgi:hypothetical protein